MGERSSPFAQAVSGQATGVAAEGLPRGSLWQVAAWGDTFSTVEADLAGACGCASPLPGRANETADGRLLIRIEPLKWWILGEDGASCPLTPDPGTGCWLDLSHDQAGIALSGPNAAEVLKRMVSVDIRDHAFPDRTFVTTQMHHMITRILRRDRDGPRYEVMVMRSYADVLREVVAHHLHHMG